MSSKDFYAAVGKPESAPARTNRSVAASKAGRKKHKAGSTFENIVRKSADESGGLVCLERVPNGAKWIGPNKTIPVPSPFDFAGTVRGGRAIMFDAKSLSEGYASFRMSSTPSGRKQLPRLRRHAQAGAIAGFLVRCERHNDVRWIDASKMPEDAPLRWTDPQWVVLGKCEGVIDFTALVSRLTAADMDATPESEA